MKENRVVYSTELGKICPECHKASANCVCKEIARNTVKGDGQVRIRRETKGRGGKTVIAISGLPLTQNQLEELLKKFKKQCGTGGTVKERVIEIQGDHLGKLKELLIREGYRPKG